MITRYTLISSIYGPMMDKSRKGDYVLYSDYEALEKKLDKERSDAGWDREIHRENLEKMKYDTWK